MGAAMNQDRIGREEAERILRAAATGPRPGHDDLTAFLAAAAAPTGEAELAGEDAAMAAFRRARGARATRRPLIARVLTVKAAVVLALSATAAGGVALAAGTGTLPGPLGGDRPAPHRTSEHPTGTSLTTGPTGGGAPASTPSTPSGAQPTPSPAPSPTPSSPGNGKDKGKNKKDKKPKKPKKSKKPHPKKSKNKKSPR
jgi:hypothetical protein